MSGNPLNNAVNLSHPDDMESRTVAYFTASSDEPVMGAIERRKNIVHVPPAMGDMLRAIVEDMVKTAEYLSNTETHDGDYWHNHMLDDANALRNCAALLDAIAEQNGGRVLRVERRED